MTVAEIAQRFLSRRRWNYRKTFNNPPGEAVLRDLAKFCRAHETTAHADPTLAAVQEGRREVWLRIQHHLQLDDKTLWEMYGKPE